jgi:hypothetical protein
MLWAVYEGCAEACDKEVGALSLRYLRMDISFLQIKSVQ